MIPVNVGTYPHPHRGAQTATRYGRDEDARVYGCVLSEPPA